MWFENQFPYFCWMVLSGSLIMLFYDTLRISRKVVSYPDFIVNIIDLLYVCLCSVAIFYVTYLKNNGEIRVQTGLGILTGMALYYFIFRNKVVEVGAKIVVAIIKILKKIIKIILYPFILILKIIFKPARVIIWYTGRGCKSIKHKTELKLKNIKQVMKKR